MNVRKHGAACEIAAAEEFDWDYLAARPDDLYEAIEAMGYAWLGGEWLGPDNPRNPRNVPPRQGELR
jgi:hypothetical protein